MLEERMPQRCGFTMLLQYNNSTTGLVTGLVLGTGLKDFPQRAQYNGEWQAPSLQNIVTLRIMRPYPSQFYGD